MQTRSPSADSANTCTAFAKQPSRTASLEADRQNTLSRYTVAQQVAVVHLYSLVKRHNGTSGGNAAAKFLLGLYNGQRFPFDLTDLRVFDDENFEAAMTVLRMDARQTYCEIHVLLNAIQGAGADTGTEFEHWAYNLRLRNRCTKNHLLEKGVAC